jgi:hypothetical protein
MVVNRAVLSPTVCYARQRLLHFRPFVHRSPGAHPDGQLPQLNAYIVDSSLRPVIKQAAHTTNNDNTQQYWLAMQWLADKHIRLLHLQP